MTPTFSHFERCIDTVRAQHPDMPHQSVVLMRLAHHVFRTLHERLDRFFAARDLSTSAWAVLMMIYSTPERAITPSEASMAVVQSRTHMTRVADDLVAAGLIERVHDEIDRRRVVLQLTASGADLVKKLLPEAWAEYRAALAIFSGDEATALETLLRRWLGHLESEDRPECGSASAPEPMRRRIASRFRRVSK
ncbi:MAG: MarR family transcriptional regulator [Candidatus Competibacteraceae bacterium]